MQWGEIHPWHVVLRISTYTTPRMTWWFWWFPQPGPTVWVLWGSDEQDPCVLIGPQARLNLSICTSKTCVGWVTTHSWYVFLCGKIYTNMRMVSLFCSSHQIWSHNLGSLRLGWTKSQCIDYAQCLLDLSHAPTIYMKCIATHLWTAVLHLATKHSKDGPAWMDDNWHTSWLCIGCDMMYHELQSPIIVLASLSIHQWVPI